MNHKHLIVSILPIFCALLLSTGCNKPCQITDRIVSYVPEYMSFDDLRSGVTNKATRNLETPGRIYLFDSYILINEQDRGIHVYDNTNPASPVPVSFIEIPGNRNMAVRNFKLFADSYVDLVVLDITDPTQVNEISRIEDLFQQRLINGLYTFPDPTAVITGYQQVESTQTSDYDCQAFPDRGEMIMMDVGRAELMATTQNDFSAQTRTEEIQNGTGGSLARFTLVDNFLYVLNGADMQLFDMSNPFQPVHWADVSIGFDIETIFPYQNKIFIGSQSGMHIYDNSDPANPLWMSTYEHITACDPVVVEGDRAYVTLRSGSPCETFVNQLDVVDISDPYNPFNMVSHSMKHPHGLGINQNVLVLCEGDDGLKVYDAGNPFEIPSRLLSEVVGINALDVILHHNNVMMIGEDGFYQYDYSNPAELQYLSKIQVH